jgi:WD40 repeat protein
VLPELPVFLTVSGDTTTFAFWTYHDRDSVQIWDRDSRQATRRLAVPWGVHVVLSPDGSLLAHQRLGGVVIHNLSAGEPLLLSSGDEERHVPIRFSRDGRYLITRCDDLTYLHWDTAKGAPTRVPFTGHYQVAVSPHGDTLAVFNIQQGAVWHVAENKVTVLPELSRRLVPSPYVFVIVLLGLGWIWGMLRLSGTRGRALSVAPPVDE